MPKNYKHTKYAKCIKYTKYIKHIKYMTTGKRNCILLGGYAGEWASLMAIKDTNPHKGLQLFDLESSNLPAREKSE